MAQGKVPGLRKAICVLGLEKQRTFDFEDKMIGLLNYIRWLFIGIALFHLTAALIVLACLAGAVRIIWNLCLDRSDNK